MDRSGSWKPSPAEYSEVHKLAEEVGATRGCTVTCRPLADAHGWAFDAPKVIAYPLWQPRNPRLQIQVEEKRAKNAGVSHLAEKRDGKGYHRRPAVYWYVSQGDAAKRKEVAAILAKL